MFGAKRVRRRPDPAESPWRFADFTTLFQSASLSQFASNTGYVALPLIAVTALHAGPAEVGALAALSTVAFLLIGLPVGAWVDRMRHRQVLILADLARALLFATIPVAWWLDRLTMQQLYVVAFAGGAATVFFDVGSQSVLPRIVGPAALVRANAAVVTLIALANVAGRGAGGALVQLLTAPVAALCSALAYLLSAVTLTRMTPVVRPPVDGTARPRLGVQIAEGLRHVLGHAELRALALTATLNNLGSQVINTMLPILFVRSLDLPAGALGAFWAVGGAGLLLGARCALPTARRLGYGRNLALIGLCVAPAALLVPLIDRGPVLWLAGLGWTLALFKTGMDNVVGVSLRQRMTPPELLGRMNATFRFLLTGALALGAALGGLLGELLGVRATLWVGAVILALAFVPVFLSPVRRRRDLPAALAVT
ncbi:MFS transporter [Aeromicrobium sp. Root236]|uniref:MFS transporter n=1 Tax=Aeromicrobium sp. Root236 TaxID=1736498 RepID=UPI0006F71360|nr:MFS transporter [Aeromicrobium sp. Root236]KRC66389.1 MFS transporter [Aeromicrobium sp. Root236]